VYISKFINTPKKHAQNSIQCLSAGAFPVNLLLDLLQAQSTKRVHQVTHHFILLLWAPCIIMIIKNLIVLLSHEVTGCHTHETKEGLALEVASVSLSLSLSLFRSLALSLSFSLSLLSRATHVYRAVRSIL